MTDGDVYLMWTPYDESWQQLNGSNIYGWRYRLQQPRLDRLGGMDQCS
jgi:hypothetical protein